MYPWFRTGDSRNFGHLPQDSELKNDPGSGPECFDFDARVLAQSVVETLEKQPRALQVVYLESKEIELRPHYRWMRGLHCVLSVLEELGACSSLPRMRVIVLKT